MCGEDVYGPDQKQHGRKAHVINNDMQIDDHVVDENIDVMLQAGCKIV